MPEASGGHGNGIVDLRPRIRRGVTYDKWPFRLDIPVEYQDWILVAMCMVLFALWTLPCACGRCKNKASRSFSNWVYTRLHVFYWSVAYSTLFITMFTIGVLPDWTVDQFLEYLELFVLWVLHHLVQMITSFVILFAFYLVFKLRERVLMAAGLEHLKLFRFNWSDPFRLRTKMRPVEVFIWKIEGLHSSAGKVLKANDIYLECHLGDNEPMRTRVRNNAGSECIQKESFQINIDEASPTELMTLLVKDQSLMTSSQVGRLVLSVAELCGIEDQTGKRRSAFLWSPEYFVPLGLSPAGKIWIAVAPVDDQNDEDRALIGDDDVLGLQC